MNGQDGDMGVWRPLPRILYGFAIVSVYEQCDRSQQAHMQGRRELLQ